MVKRKIKHLLTGLLFAFAGTAAAETIYVQDYLRLSVRAAPASSGTSLEVVSTGDALTVLERDGDYIRVRTTEGTEGWVSKAYVSEEPPARLQLEELRKEYERTQAETADLRRELAANSARSEAMAKRLEAVTAEKAALEQQLERYTSSAARLTREYAWLIQSVILIGLFLFGFYIGVRWYKRRLADRLGGLEF